jgi:hypothetical protein
LGRYGPKFNLAGNVLCKLVRNRQTQQINRIGHELQGVLCKVRTYNPSLGLLGPFSVELLIPITTGPKN